MLNCKEEREITGMLLLQNVLGLLEFLSFILIGEVTDAFLTSPVLNSYSAVDPRDLPDQVQELGNHGLVMQFLKLSLL